jgi:nicotinamidase-related amidase
MGCKKGVENGSGVALLVVDMQNDFCEANSPGRSVTRDRAQFNSAKQG